MGKHAVISFLLLIFGCIVQAQQPLPQLAAKVNAMQHSQQLEHGVVSLCVADVATGQIIYSINEQMGLMPASNMKVFTAIAALDLLGKDYKYKTEVGYNGHLKDSTLTGNLFLVGYGDPTTGSWRYGQSLPDSIMSKIGAMLHNAGINKIVGEVILDGSKFSFNPIPGGWSWEDMGSYYGAGNWGLNWHENQYDMVLKPAKKLNDSVAVKSSDPDLSYVSIINELRTAGANTGDNSYPYLPPYGDIGIIEGTIPTGGLFTVSGSLPEPYTTIATALKKLFADSNIIHNGTIESSMDFRLAQKKLPHYDSLISTIYSPGMDSIIYWFLKKSVNLYGEVLIKTMALEQNGYGSTDGGTDIMSSYWQKHGIEQSAFHIADGSGLSAKDHVTTDGLVHALLYAKTRPWFNTFYNALPVYNNMHMKSGTISGVKAYSGYHTGAGGRQYAFSMIVNNYDGSADSVISKMFNVLDELKK